MDKMVWLAWRAFWVGLGASVVLIGQTLLTPPAPEAPSMPAATESRFAPSIAFDGLDRSDDRRVVGEGRRPLAPTTRVLQTCLASTC